MDFSRLLLVRQNFPDRSIADIPGEVSRQLSMASFGPNLKPGSRIAIGVGSRGIRNIATIVRATVDYWKGRGMQPFLFPAMGSHGAATAAGQADVLAHYGIDESTMGCPVVSQLDVVSLGKTDDGIEAFLDKAAYEADGVMMVGRVKWHTDFAGKIESGLFKMMAIGLGKFAGAQRYHTYAYKLGLEKVVRTVGRQVLASGKIIGGLAILEDANHNTAKLAAVPVATMEQDEEKLLVEVKSWMGRIPFDIDILILDEIGKNYSGAGMDTKVVNRGVTGLYNPWDTAPRIERIYVRGLHPDSYGNASGVGLADIVHDRLVNAIDWKPSYINSLTSSVPSAVRLPIHFPSDQECIEKLAQTVGKLDMSTVTFAWIANSLDIKLLALSENLRSEIEKRHDLEIVEEPIPFTWDGEGNMNSPVKRAEAAH